MSERVWTRVSAGIARNKGNERKGRASWWPGLALGAALVALVVVAVGRRDKRDEHDTQANGPSWPDGPPAIAVASWWPRMAAAAVVLAVVIAALGPLPATGFADHPFATFGRSVAEYVGVRETARRCRRSGSERAGGIGGARRDDRRGLRAARRSAEYRAGSAGGVRARGVALLRCRADGGQRWNVRPDLRRAGGQASVVVYQERASEGELAAGEGAVIEVALKDGTAATYVKGAWQASGDALTWSADGGQSLVFERAGLRTTLQYTGPQATGPLALRAGGEHGPGRVARLTSCLHRPIDFRDPIAIGNLNSARIFFFRRFSCWRRADSGH